MLEKSPLDCKEIQPVYPKENQSWIFTGRTDAETEASVLWLPDVKSQLIGKNPHAGKDWGQEEKEATEDVMVGWHHWLSGDEFDPAPGDSEGQGSLVCCSPRGCRVGHSWATEQKQQWQYLKLSFSGRRRLYSLCGKKHDIYIWW